MAAPLRVRLDQAAQAELEHRYQGTRDATTRIRYQMVLLRAEGHPVVAVARITRRSPDTVRRVLKRYQVGGPDAVPHRLYLGQPPHYPPAWEHELVRVLRGAFVGDGSGTAAGDGCGLAGGMAVGMVVIGSGGGGAHGQDPGRGHRVGVVGCGQSPVTSVTAA